MQQAAAREAGRLIQSVQRAVSLLKAFDAGSPELGVSELARRVQLHKSTVSRLLATLERDGLVERVAGADTYRLGFEIVRLAGLVSHFGDVRAAAAPVLRELADVSGETVNLAILDGDGVINVEQVSGMHMVRDTNWVGRRTPLTCVANGKVLLARRPASEIDSVLSRPLPRFTRHTVTDVAALRSELALVAARGYATAFGEIEEGLHAVAAPVLGAGGETVAAVSVSGPAYRVTEYRVPEIVGLLNEAAARIAARLGVSPVEGVSVDERRVDRSRRAGRHKSDEDQSPDRG